MRAAPAQAVPEDREETEVREKTAEAPPLAGVSVGRDSREVRLLAKLLDGFANPVRLSALLLLSRHGEMSVSELVEAIGAPQPRISDHLRCLVWCGYVRSRREGANSFIPMVCRFRKECLIAARRGLIYG